MCLIHLHSFICSAKIMPTWTSTLNQLIAIIAFESHFKNLQASSISLSLPILHLKNISKGFYSSVLKLERIAVFHVGQRNIILPNIAQKNHGLALMLFKSMLMQCDRQISVIIFCCIWEVLWKWGQVLSRMSLLGEGVFFKHKIQSNIFLWLYR